MKKVLFLATYPTQSNGYARIGNILSNHLAKTCEVYYFGFSNYPGTFVPRYIDPSIKLIDVIQEEELRSNDEGFGVGIITEFMNSIKPDIVLIYNDIIVTCRHLNKLNQLEKYFKVINYLDLVYDFENPVYMNHVNRSCDKILAFSEHWKNNMITMGVPESKISILNHGLDNRLFFKIDKKEARKALGLREDNFYILNTNRNSYRKANDITISAFLLLLKKVNFDKRFKLLLHCDLDNNSGYNLRNIIKTECMKYGIDSEYVSNNLIETMGVYRITDEKMNLMYNACDVGINTCIGEGFGLCNLEHAGLGKPQVVSNVGGLKDIFKDFPEMTINPVAEYNISSHTDGHNGLAYLCRAVDFADRLYDIYTNYEKYKEIAEKCAEHIQERFNWDTILSGFKI